MIYKRLVNYLRPYIIIKKITIITKYHMNNRYNNCLLHVSYGYIYAFIPTCCYYTTIIKNTSFLIKTNHILQI